MKVMYNKKNSPEKKQLIAAICEITGATSKYMGPPTMRYQIGELVVDRDGNLVVADGMEAAGLIAALKERGYEGEVEMTVQVTPEQTLGAAPSVPAPVLVTEETAPAQAQTAEETLPQTTGFSISLPKGKLPGDAMEKLGKILESKGKLILKALGASSLVVEQDEEKVNFPWFDRIPEADQVEAYTRFIAAIAKMAREQKRVSAKEKPNENEKYAFRCFLLRLGFIGDEFKKDRKILLKNFDGSSAFRTQESADRAKEKQEAKKAEEGSVPAESDAV